MTKQTEEALKMAIEALEDYPYEHRTAKMDDALQACKEALEQPAQEPVAWISVNNRLPNNDGKYIVYGNCTNDGYQHDMAIFSEGKFRKYNQPTHWMLFPSKPNKTNTHPAPSCNGEWSEKIMNQWIDIRKLIADGNTSSYPRDWFESLAPSWQGLSDDEILNAVGSSKDSPNVLIFLGVARAIEQALKDKNT